MFPERVNSSRRFTLRQLRVKAAGGGQAKSLGEDEDKDHTDEKARLLGVRADPGVANLG